MNKFLNAFYLKYIRPVDPGFFIAKYAAKAAFSCLVSFIAALLIGLKGEGFFWCMAGAVCTVLFRTGSTLKRRKIYALILLALVAVFVPVAAMVGQYDYLSLGFVFLLSFACFFVSSAGVSASTIGHGCLLVSLLSLFSPAGAVQGIIRSITLLFGGLISYVTNFYLWPFDPEKILFSSAKLAIEDMGFLLEGVCLRVKNPNVSEEQLAFLSKEAINSVKRYRTFMESFNIDPLKGSGTSGGPGLFYFALIRMFESIVGLSNHIHFADNRPEFDEIKNDFYKTTAEVSHEFDKFAKIERKQAIYHGTDFGKMNDKITQLQMLLLNMGGYKKGDEVQNKFLEAWAAIYELKTVVTEFRAMTHLARAKFKLRKE
ncbi:hypothetical protein [Desulfocicer niacini]